MKGTEGAIGWCSLIASLLGYLFCNSELRSGFRALEGVILPKDWPLFKSHLWVTWSAWERFEQVIVFGVVFGTSADLAAFYIPLADHIFAHRRVLHTSAEAEISRG